MDAFATLGFPSLPATGHETAIHAPRPPEVGDEALLPQIVEGNKDALGELFNRYASTVRRIALRVLWDAAEADDLVQDVFLLIHRFAGAFDPSKASARFWIIQMTYRRAISRRQYLNTRHYYRQLQLDDPKTQATDRNLAQHDASIDRRLAELDLQKMFSSLSEDQQKTLCLHFIEGYTLDEIAKMLGQTKGNIRHHSFRGLERLRRLVFADESPGTSAV